ncbi:MAG TPA: hypothetical protein VGO96_17935 [Pyrinomonadaceae bacterium]|jgi:hypothetical protein|nr:hypothetical protein [Pyrinomonadaceae bacterium]
MSKNIVKIAKRFKLASLILFVALVGGQTLNVDALTQTRAGSGVLKAELKSSAEAKRALSNIGTRDFKRVKDARLRNASTRALADLKALANNTSTAREATLAANFARSVKTLKGLAQPGTTAIEECDKGYERCIELCKETGGNCDLCGISQNGCYLTKLAIEMTKDPLDPTP